MTKFEWTIREGQLELAEKSAEQVVLQLQLDAPIDPYEIVKAENGLLRMRGANLKDRYDGKLEYNSANGVFLLFFNNKYDEGTRDKQHHARTRFSICHELGHYFIERHHQFLASGENAHNSKGEFTSDGIVEREADRFSAAMLLPSHLLKPVINRQPLSIEVLDSVVSDFDVSRTCAAIRCVKASDFPTAVACIRAGEISWLLPNEVLIKAGCYPGSKSIKSAAAIREWQSFLEGRDGKRKGESKVAHWFEVYDKDELGKCYVTEEYVHVRPMNSLLVLLTLDELEISTDDEDDELDEAEEYIPSWNRKRG